MRAAALVLALAAAAEASADVESADETFDMTRAEFLEQFTDVDDTRAERLWRAYEQQHDAGDLEFFYDTGHERRARFRVPLTHAIAPYLFPQLVDAIEGAHAVLLDAYRCLTASQRDWIAAALDVADTYFAIEILIALLLGAAAVDFARGSRRDAAADGARRKDE
jgi:hypothetical protein